MKNQRHPRLNASSDGAVEKAVMVLRSRTETKERLYSPHEIEEAVRIVKAWDADHPVLRYHEKRN